MKEMTEQEIMEAYEGLMDLAKKLFPYVTVRGNNGYVEALLLSNSEEVSLAFDAIAEIKTDELDRIEVVTRAQEIDCDLEEWR